MRLRVSGGVKVRWVHASRWRSGFLRYAARKVARTAPVEMTISSLQEESATAAVRADLEEGEEVGGAVGVFRGCGR